MSTEIPHSRNCKRPVPILRLSWRQQPELFCPACGRTTPLPTPDPVDLDESPLHPRADRPTT